MKSISCLLITLTCSVLPLMGQESPIEYRFDQVRSKVVVTSASLEHRASEGTVAHGGDRVRTGWLGYALLAAPRYAARFEVFSGSEVTLAGGVPGVILTVERGRLKAIFDKITGEEPRIVRTPGALLAVRGTRYGIEVGRDGIADLVVFEGTVEVRSHLRPEPLLVRAGETCRFSMNTPPMAMPMPKGMNEGMWQRHGAGGGMDRGTMPRDGGMGGGSRDKPPMPGSGHH